MRRGREKCSTLLPSLCSRGVWDGLCIENEAISMVYAYTAKVILNNQSVAEVTSLSLNYTTLVREQCSADCITLHDYHVYG